MAVPFRREGDREELCCAYLELVEGPPMRGGLLLTDSRGMPKEFVYNQIAMPSGVLWPAAAVRKAAAATLAHSLFEACQGSPVLVLGRYGLQEDGFSPISFGVSIPFALADENRLTWVGLEPSSTHPARVMSVSLADGNLLQEPFERIVKALDEVFLIRSG